MASSSPQGARPASPRAQQARNISLNWFIASHMRALHSILSELLYAEMDENSIACIIFRSRSVKKMLEGISRAMGFRAPESFGPTSLEWDIAHAPTASEMEMNAIATARSVGAKQESGLASARSTGCSGAQSFCSDSGLGSSAATLLAVAESFDVGAFSGETLVNALTEKVLHSRNAAVTAMGGSIPSSAPAVSSSIAAQAQLYSWLNQGKDQATARRAVAIIDVATLLALGRLLTGDERPLEHLCVLVMHRAGGFWSWDVFGQPSDGIGVTSGSSTFSTPRGEDSTRVHRVSGLNAELARVPLFHLHDATIEKVTSYAHSVTLNEGEMQLPFRRIFMELGAEVMRQTTRAAGHLCRPGVPRVVEVCTDTLCRLIQDLGIAKNYSILIKYVHLTAAISPMCRASLESIWAGVERLGNVTKGRKDTKVLLAQLVTALFSMHCFDGFHGAERHMLQDRANRLFTQLVREWLQKPKYNPFSLPLASVLLPLTSRDLFAGEFVTLYSQLHRSLIDMDRRYRVAVACALQHLLGFYLSWCAGPPRAPPVTDARASSDGDTALPFLKTLSETLEGPLRKVQVTAVAIPSIGVVADTIVAVCRTRVEEGVSILVSALPSDAAHVHTEATLAATAALMLLSEVANNEAAATDNISEWALPLKLPFWPFPPIPCATSNISSEAAPIVFASPFSSLRHSSAFEASFGAAHNPWDVVIDTRRMNGPNPLMRSRLRAALEAHRSAIARALAISFVVFEKECVSSSHLRLGGRGAATSSGGSSGSGQSGSNGGSGGAMSAAFGAFVSAAVSGSSGMTVAAYMASLGEKERALQIIMSMTLLCSRWWLPSPPLFALLPKLLLHMNPDLQRVTAAFVVPYFFVCEHAVRDAHQIINGIADLVVTHFNDRGVVQILTAHVSQFVSLFTQHVQYIRQKAVADINDRFVQDAVTCVALALYRRSRKQERGGSHWTMATSTRTPTSTLRASASQDEQLGASDSWGATQQQQQQSHARTSSSRRSSATDLLDPAASDCFMDALESLSILLMGHPDHNVRLLALALASMGDEAHQSVLLLGDCCAANAQHNFLRRSRDSTDDSDDTEGASRAGKTQGGRHHQSEDCGRKVEAVSITIPSNEVAEDAQIGTDGAALCGEQRDRVTVGHLIRSCGGVLRDQARSWISRCAALSSNWSEDSTGAKLRRVGITPFSPTDAGVTASQLPQINVIFSFRGLVFRGPRDIVRRLASEGDHWDAMQRDLLSTGHPQVLALMTALMLARHAAPSTVMAVTRLCTSPTLTGIPQAHAAPSSTGKFDSPQDEKNYFDVWKIKIMVGLPLCMLTSTGQIVTRLTSPSNAMNFTVLHDFQFRRLAELLSGSVHAHLMKFPNVQDVVDAVAFCFTFIAHVRAPTHGMIVTAQACTTPLLDVCKRLSEELLRFLAVKKERKRVAAVAPAISAIIHAVSSHLLAEAFPGSDVTASGSLLGTPMVQQPLPSAATAFPTGASATPMPSSSAIRSVSAGSAHADLVSNSLDGAASSDLTLASASGRNTRVFWQSSVTSTGSTHLGSSPQHSAAAAPTLSSLSLVKLFDVIDTFFAVMVIGNFGQTSSSTWDKNAFQLSAQTGGVSSTGMLTPLPALDAKKRDLRAESRAEYDLWYSNRLSFAEVGCSPRQKGSEEDFTASSSITWGNRHSFETAAALRVRSDIFSTVAHICSSGKQCQAFYRERLVLWVTFICFNLFSLIDPITTGLIGNAQSSRYQSFRRGPSEPGDFVEQGLRALSAAVGLPLQTYFGSAHSIEHGGLVLMLCENLQLAAASVFGEHRPPPSFAAFGPLRFFMVSLLTANPKTFFDFALARLRDAAVGTAVSAFWFECIAAAVFSDPALLEGRKSRRKRRGGPSLHSTGGITSAIRHSSSPIPSTVSFDRSTEVKRHAWNGPPAGAPHHHQQQQQQKPHKRHFSQAPTSAGSAGGGGASSATATAAGDVEYAAVVESLFAPLVFRALCEVGMKTPRWEMSQRLLALLFSTPVATAVDPAFPVAPDAAWAASAFANGVDFWCHVILKALPTLRSSYLLSVIVDLAMSTLRAHHTSHGRGAVAAASATVGAQGSVGSSAASAKRDAPCLDEAAYLALQHTMMNIVAHFTAVVDLKHSVLLNMLWATRTFETQWSEQLLMMWRGINYNTPKMLKAASKLVLLHCNPDEQALVMQFLVDTRVDDRGESRVYAHYLRGLIEAVRPAEGVFVGNADADEGALCRVLFLSAMTGLQQLRRLHMSRSATRGATYADVGDLERASHSAASTRRVGSEVSTSEEGVHDLSALDGVFASLWAIDHPEEATVEWEKDSERQWASIVATRLAPMMAVAASCLSVIGLVIPSLLSDNEMYQTLAYDLVLPSVLVGGRVCGGNSARSSVAAISTAAPSRSASPHVLSQSAQLAYAEPRAESKSFAAAHGRGAAASHNRSNGSVDSSGTIRIRDDDTSSLEDTARHGDFDLAVAAAAAEREMLQASQGPAVAATFDRLLRMTILHISALLVEHTSISDSSGENEGAQWKTVAHTRVGVQRAISALLDHIRHSSQSGRACSHGASRSSFQRELESLRSVDQLVCNVASKLPPSGVNSWVNECVKWAAPSPSPQSSPQSPTAIYLRCLSAKVLPHLLLVAGSSLRVSLAAQLAAFGGLGAQDPSYHLLPCSSDSFGEGVQQVRPILKELLPLQLLIEPATKTLLRQCGALAHAGLTGVPASSSAAAQNSTELKHLDWWRSPGARPAISLLLDSTVRSLEAAYLTNLTPKTLGLPLSGNPPFATAIVSSEVTLYAYFWCAFGLLLSQFPQSFICGARMYATLHSSGSYHLFGPAGISRVPCRIGLSTALMTTMKVISIERCALLIILQRISAPATYQQHSVEEAAEIGFAGSTEVDAVRTSNSSTCQSDARQQQSPRRPLPGKERRTTDNSRFPFSPSEWRRVLAGSLESLWAHCEAFPGATPYICTMYALAVAGSDDTLAPEILLPSLCADKNNPFASMLLHFTKLAWEGDVPSIQNLVISMFESIHMQNPTGCSRQGSFTAPGSHRGPSKRDNAIQLDYWQRAELQLVVFNTVVGILVSPLVADDVRQRALVFLATILELGIHNSFIVECCYAFSDEILDSVDQRLVDNANGLPAEIATVTGQFLNHMAVVLARRKATKEHAADSARPDSANAVKLLVTLCNNRDLAIALFRGIASLEISQQDIEKRSPDPATSVDISEPLGPLHRRSKSGSSLSIPLAAFAPAGQDAAAMNPFPEISTLVFPDHCGTAFQRSRQSGRRSSFQQASLHRRTQSCLVSAHHSNRSGNDFGRGRDPQEDSRQIRAGGFSLTESVRPAIPPSPTSLEDSAMAHKSGGLSSHSSFVIHDIAAAATAVVASATGVRRGSALAVSDPASSLDPGLVTVEPQSDVSTSLRFNLYLFHEDGAGCRVEASNGSDLCFMHFDDANDGDIEPVSQSEGTIASLTDENGQRLPQSSRHLGPPNDSHTGHDDGECFAGSNAHHTPTHRRVQRVFATPPSGFHFFSSRDTPGSAQDALLEGSAAGGLGIEEVTLLTESVMLLHRNESDRYGSHTADDDDDDDGDNASSMCTHSRLSSSTGGFDSTTLSQAEANNAVASASDDHIGS